MQKKMQEDRKGEEEKMRRVFQVKMLISLNKTDFLTRE